MHTVGKRVVHILLKYFLVDFVFVTLGNRTMAESRRTDFLFLANLYQFSGQATDNSGTMPA